MRPLQQYYEFIGTSLHCHHLSIPSQGNVRCVVRHDGTLVESNEYYPYGGLFSATASAQLYKYGSKELDRTNGLDLYDSEARWYDSILGRTTTMDPLAEKYYSISPYLWCAGNPVKFVDPSGLYHAKVGKHQGKYDALRLFDTNNNRRIALGDKNPQHPERDYAEGINIHKAGINNYTGVTKNGSGVSEGCFLIERNKWNDFINLFLNSSKQSVV